MDKKKFNGIFPPILTVLDSKGKLDKKGMGALIDKLIKDGVNGLLFLGSAGEFCHMPKEQRKEIADFVVSYTKKRVPVMLGVGSTSTEEAIEYGLQADELEVDAVLALNPYYAKLSDEGIINHFRTLAKGIKTPVILYNFPEFTGQDLTVPLIAQLADIPGIIGIKNTVNNASHLREILNVVRPKHPDFVVFAGYDEYIMDALIIGANGGIPATSNFAAFITCGIYASFKSKDYEKMFAFQRQLSKLSSLYAIETPFYGIAKEAVNLVCGLGIPTDLKLPVPKASKAGIERLKEILRRAEVPFKE